MTHEEATLLLQAFRPGGGDDQDGFFEEALDQVQQDPTLREWFLSQRKFDRAISRQLAGVPVPAGLTERLLTSLVVVKPGFRETYMNWVALAASLALLVVVALNWRPKAVPADFAEYRASIPSLAVAARADLEVLDSDLAALKRRLAERGAPGPEFLPESLQQLRPIGCAVIDWEGHNVGLVSYQSEGIELNLLMVERAGFLGAPVGDAPAVAQAGAWTTAGWTDGQTLYLLAAKTTPTRLQKYL
ncbi:MAG: hypothetical protein H7A46_24100 [Verrucomicrobiales bacterium]|nr:hypothetical protein [Verrucomicrobiales bacterium]